MSENEKSRQAVEPTTCYRVGAMPFVPHFVVYGVYVAPGGRMTTKAQLEAAGATKYQEFLWPRPSTDNSKGFDGWKQFNGLGEKT